MQITAEQAAAELARRRGNASVASVAAPVITADQAAVELARRKEAAAAAQAELEQRRIDDPKTFRDFQLRASREDRGTMDALSRGIMQGVTLGFADEIVGGMMTPIELGIGAYTGEDEGKGVLERIADSYGRGVATQRNALDTARENHGTATLLGEIGGGLGTAGLTVAKGAAKLGLTGASRLGKIGLGAADGVALGAASGFGAGEGLDDSLDGAGTGAVLGLGLGAAVPAIAPVVRKTVSAGKTAIAPFTKSGQERLAAEKLGAGASDLAGLRAALASPTPDLVPGSAPTTFQLTGDMGVGGLERAAATRAPAPFQDRRAAQNSARLGAMGGVETGGAAESVAAAARLGFDDLDRSTQGLLDDATNTARRATDAVGPGMTPDVAGDTMRLRYEASRAPAKSAERGTWDAVDPDGTLSLGLPSYRSRAAELEATHPKLAKPMEGEEAALVEAGKSLPQQVPFAEVQALNSRIGAAARQEMRDAGESPVHRRLGLLGSSLADDLDNAAAGMPFADGSMPTFDQAARGRLAAANKATKDRVEIFDNDLLAPIRARPSKSSPYDMPSSAVPGRIFFGEPRSFDAVNVWRRAVGDQTARDALQGYVVDRLRKTALAADGTLDAARLASFRQQHADALRAFPDLDRKFADAGTASSAMAEVAAARTKSLADYEKGVLGSLMKLDDPADVTKTIGGIFNSRDGVSRMSQISQSVAGDPDAQQGLRRAVVDHMKQRLTSNTEAATSGEALLKGDAFQTFVGSNRATMKAAGFTDAELDTFGAIAADIQRANRSLTAVKIPGQSNTAQDVGSVLSRVLQASGSKGGGLGLGGVGFLAGGLPGAVAGGLTAGTAKMLSIMKANGLERVEDILQDALLNPDRAKILLTRLDPNASPVEWEKLAQSFARAGTTTTNLESGAEPRSRAPFQN